MLTKKPKRNALTRLAEGFFKKQKNDQYDAIKLQWDPVENDHPFPEDPYKNKHIMGKWKCDKGHFWYETIEGRAYHQKCHMCYSPWRATETYNLYALRPDIAAQLHPTKNGSITADELTPFSPKIMVWVCEKSHEWKTRVCTRTYGHGCPECANRKVGKDNSLAVLYPQYIEEWDPEANGDLTPHDVMPGSNRKVAWKCQKGHKWKARIGSRVSQGQGCPKCKNIIPINRQRAKVKELVKRTQRITKIPDEVLKQFHPTKNGAFKIEHSSPYSAKIALWQCEKGHESKASIYTRAVLKYGCPECANKKVGKDNNLAVLYPHYIEEWDQEANGDLTPQGVMPGSNKKVAWKCQKGHKWIARIYDRVIQEQHCPECTNQKVGKDNNLAVINPELANEWHPIKNGELTPFDVVPGSGQKVWWKCHKDHEWQALTRNRSRGKGCPECTNHKVGKDNNLAVLYPHYIEEWDQEANGTLTPQDVMSKSSKKVAWKCQKGHKWIARICNRVRKGDKCPECANQKVGKDNNLAVLYPHIAHQLHPTLNGTITAFDILSGSSKKFFWQCEKRHIWEAAVYARVKGSECPECANRKVGKDNSLAVLYPHYSEEWDQEANGDLTPQDVIPKSSKKVAWKCQKGHKWIATLDSRVRKGSGCPECINRRVGKDNNLAVLYPHIAHQLHPTLNGTITAFDILASSRKKFFWQCENKGHIWETTVHTRVNGSGCPICYAERKKIKA